MKPFQTKNKKAELPKKGRVVIGYKKACFGKKVGVYEYRNDFWGNKKGIIVKLLIPASALRVMGTNGGNLRGLRKCRAEQAKVLSFSSKVPLTKVVLSDFDCMFEYKIGETVKPKHRKFRKNSSTTCGAGIHFFLTEAQARAYRI